MLIYRKDNTLRDNERKLIGIVSSLEEKYNSILVIVEGKRDVRILRDLGYSGKIIRTQTGSTRQQVADQIVDEMDTDGSVLILTDYDKEGIEIAKFLEKELEIRKVQVLKGLRLRIRKFMGTCRCIEELISLFKKHDSPVPD